MCPCVCVSSDFWSNTCNKPLQSSLSGALLVLMYTVSGFAASIVQRRVNRKAFAHVCTSLKRRSNAWAQRSLASRPERAVKHSSHWLLWNYAENPIKRKIHQMLRGQTTRLGFFCPSTLFNNAQGKKGVEYHCGEELLCVCPSPLKHKSLKESWILSCIFFFNGRRR